MIKHSWSQSDHIKHFAWYFSGTNYKMRLHRMQSILLFLWLQCLKNNTLNRPPWRVKMIPWWPFKANNNSCNILDHKMFIKNLKIKIKIDNFESEIFGFWVLFTFSNAGNENKCGLYLACRLAAFMFESNLKEKMIKCTLASSITSFIIKFNY